MNDTDDVNQSPCCMRKNPTYKEQIYDGVHANVALYAVYLAAYASGFKFICLGSFLSILLNSVYMWTIWDKAYPNEVEEPDSLNTSLDSDDSHNSEDEIQVCDKNLSLKQREHGATLAKPMDEEDEIILNSRFQAVVEETMRRNEQRLNEKLPRTPTNTSLTELDEYADMPPLVYLSSDNSSNVNHYGSSIRNNIIPNNPLNDEIYTRLVPTVNEIIRPSKNTMLHGMDDVD